MQPKATVVRVGAPLALAFLIVIAGCSAAGVGTDAPAESAPAGSSPTANASGSGPDATSPTPEDPPVAEPPLDVPAVLDAHETRLREAGSYTVRQNVTLTAANRTVSQWTVARHDRDAGRALVVRAPLSGSRSTTYLAANGSAYRRTTLASGATNYFPEEADPPANLTRPGIVRLAANLSLSYEGRTTHRNATGHLYVSENASAFAATSEEFDRSEVVAFDYALVLADDGLVRYAGYELTVETDDGRRTATGRIRYVAVGTTTIEQPAWLGEAVAAVEAPGPNDQVTREFAAENDDGRVVQAITAPKADLDRGGAGVGPTISENPAYYNENLDAARVGPVVRLYWPEEATRVEATFHYDESQLPREGDEANLTVTVMDREKGTFVRIGDREGVSVEADSGANTVTVVVENEAVLERFQGRTVVAMDWAYWVEVVWGDG